MIYNAPSIYKQGGGGGGYNDGGALVDGDFIKVENNTVSSYDNVSRDPVNFYFEVKDGEVINSVIELTTSLNATINVYVLRNGLYYLLNISGSNTVSGGNEYNINIVGNSYAIENVTIQNPDPELAEINGTISKIVKNRNIYWSDFLTVDQLHGINNIIGVVGYSYRKNYIRDNIIPNLSGGWRSPTLQEMQDLLDDWTSIQLRSTSLWQDIPNGTNESGMNFTPCGYVWALDPVDYYNKYKCSYTYGTYYNGRYYDFQIGKDVYGNDSAFIGNDTDSLGWRMVRVVHDA